MEQVGVSEQAPARRIPLRGEGSCVLRGTLEVRPAAPQAVRTVVAAVRAQCCYLPPAVLSPRYETLSTCRVLAFCMILTPLVRGSSCLPLIFT